MAWRLRDVLTLIYVSALFAVVLMPVVDSIVLFEIRGGRRISRAPAIALILGSVFLVLGLLFALGLPPVIRDMRQFAADLPGRIPTIVARLRRIPMADKLGVDSIASKVESGLSNVAEFLFASFPAWMGRIFDLVTAVILCIYFMLEGNLAYQWFMSLLPINNRLRLAVTLEKAEIRMSKWLIGQGLLMLILGVCSTIAFFFLHVRYFALLGVLMGLMNIIPIAGGVITILIVGAVAALDSWGKTGRRLPLLPRLRQCGECLPHPTHHALQRRPHGPHRPHLAHRRHSTRRSSRSPRSRTHRSPHRRPDGGVHGPERQPVHSEASGLSRAPRRPHPPPPHRRAPALKALTDHLTPLLS